MSIWEPKIGKEIEQQMASLLRFWGFAVTVKHFDGIDLEVERAGLTASLEVKAMRTWVLNINGQGYGHRTRGRPVIRPESHLMLLEAHTPAYVFVQYELRSTPSSDQALDIGLRDMTWVPADQIKTGGKRVTLPITQVLGFPVLHPGDLMRYMRGDKI